MEDQTISIGFTEEEIAKIQTNKKIWITIKNGKPLLISADPLPIQIGKIGGKDDNLKKYLHFYYGLQVVTFNNPEATTQQLHYLTAKTLVKWNENKLRLCVRPFSNMSKEEGHEFADLKEKAWNNDQLPMGGIGAIAEWLLAHRFDLFDLVKKGLADQLILNGSITPV